VARVFSYTTDGEAFSRGYAKSDFAVNHRLVYPRAEAAPPKSFELW